MANKYYFLHGGTERYLFTLSSLLEKHGHSTVPFAMRDPKNVPTPWNEFFVSRVATDRVSFSLSGLKTAGRIIYSFEARKKFARLLAKTTPDIVHVHNIYHQISPSILPVASAMGVPAVMTAHDYKLIAPNYSLYHDGICRHTKPDRYWQAVRYRCVKNSRLAGALEAVEMSFHKKWGLYLDHLAKIIAPTEFVATMLADYGVPEDKLVVVPHPASMQVDDAAPEVGEYMLYVGRLVSEKGVDVLIRAAAKVPRIPVRIVGVGPEEAELKTLAHDLGARNVTFVGFKDGAALREEYRLARAVVVPSVWYEVFGLICLEAYAMGKPVIASAIGGLPEVIQDGVTGLLCKPGQSGILAEQLQALWEQPAKALRLGEAGKRLLSSQFSLDMHYARIMKVYASIK